MGAYETTKQNRERVIGLYSATTLHLKDIEVRLSELGFPVEYELPGPEVPEPFIVVGSHSSNTGRSSLNGPLIEDNTLNVDIYLSKRSRTAAEEVRSKAVRLIGRREGVDSTIMTDDSIGRETYHIAIRISDILI